MLLLYWLIFILVSWCVGLCGLIYKCRTCLACLQQAPSSHSNCSVDVTSLDFTVHLLFLKKDSPGLQTWLKKLFNRTVNSVVADSVTQAVAHQPPLVCGILQARVLEWVAMPSSRGSSQPRTWTHVSCISCIGRWTFYCWDTGEAQ